MNQRTASTKAGGEVLRIPQVITMIHFDPSLRMEGERSTKVPLDETRVEFDEDKIGRTLNDVRDEVYLNARRAT
jgi:hypothetical protein